MLGEGTAINIMLNTLPSSRMTPYLHVESRREHDRIIDGDVPNLEPCTEYHA